MYCTNCGTKLSGNTNFCPHCGLKVNMQAYANAPSYSPAVKSTEKPAGYNVFTLISAGITGVMIILFFMPWLISQGKAYSMFTSITNLLELDIVPVFFCALIMLAVEVMLVFSLVFILRKKGTALGLIIASSATTAFSLAFIWLSDYAISFVTTTFVPVLMLILSVANIIFYIISRKAGR